MTSPTFTPLTGNEAIAEYDLSSLRAGCVQPRPWLSSQPPGTLPSYRLRAANRVLFVPGQLLDDRCHDWWLMTHGTKPETPAEREKRFRVMLKDAARPAVRPAVCSGEAWVLNARVNVPHSHPQLAHQPYIGLSGHEITRFGWCGCTPMEADIIGEQVWLQERSQLQDWAAKLLLEHSELFAAAVVDNMTYTSVNKGGVRLLVAW